MPRVNAATRDAVWWSVLAFVLLLPVMRVMPARPSGRRVSRRPYPPPYPHLSTARPSPLPRTRPARPSVRRSCCPPVPGPRCSSALWCAVCLAQCARLACSFRHLRRLKRDARPASPEQQANLDAWMLDVRHPPSGPAAGFRPRAHAGRRRISCALPSSCPKPCSPNSRAAELDHVLLHELAHLARRDDWTNLLARLAWAVLALHPVAAFALRQIDRERELACDDWVVSATGAARPYAASLARLFELCAARRRILLASGIADGGSQLGDRIALLLRRGREFTPRASALRVSSVHRHAAFLRGRRLARPGVDRFAQAQAPVSQPDARATGEPPRGRPRSGAQLPARRPRRQRLRRSFRGRDRRV